MAYQTAQGVPQVVIGYPVPAPSSAATSPPPPPRPWWHRPIVTYPADGEPTKTEETAYCAAPCAAFLTILAVTLTLIFINNAHYHADFSVQSVAVSPNSSATWHVDFLVKNPSSRYSIYYDDPDASVRLGPLNAAVLTNSHTRRSRDHSVFSLAFVAEGGSNNRSDVVLHELEIKLRAKHRRFIISDKPGHVDVRCQNLIRISHRENKEMITCQSSFTLLNIFCHGY